MSMLPFNKGVSVEATLGDKKQKGQLGDEIVAEEVVVNNELDYLLLFVAILGWVLPTPMSIFTKLTRR